MVEDYFEGIHIKIYIFLNVRYTTAGILFHKRDVRELVLTTLLCIFQPKNTAAQTRMWLKYDGWIEFVRNLIPRAIATIITQSSSIKKKI